MNVQIWDLDLFSVICISNLGSHMGAGVCHRQGSSGPIVACQIAEKQGVRVDICEEESKESSNCSPTDSMAKLTL